MKDKIDDFHHIEEVPLGSGSVAQVHSCTLKKAPEQEYVVKVLHHNVQELHQDLDLFAFLLPILSIVSSFNIHWDDLINSIRIQTDLRQEAINIKKFHKKIRHINNITVPHVVFYTRSFIVMTKLPGENLYKSPSKSTILNTSALFVYTSMLDGTFHGDMHAGNVLVDKRNHISLIDFGICHVLPKRFMFQVFMLYQERSLEVIMELMNMISISPISEDVYIEVYTCFQKKEIIEFKNAFDSVRIIIDIMIKHNMVINVDITLWLVQYAYLEYQLSFYTPPDICIFFACLATYV